MGDEKPKRTFLRKVIGFLAKFAKRKLARMVEEEFIPFLQEKVDAGECDQAVDKAIGAIGAVAKDYIEKKL